MKLLIQQDITFAWAVPPGFSSDDLAAELEYYRELEQLAKAYSLWSSFSFSETGVEVTVLAQKVTLDEIAMNALFTDFLNELFIVETRYAALGGAGCGFSMELVNAAPRPVLSPRAG